ncbi:hypothetical protein WT60_23505 [Burkholderia sp. MSMB617WGS]|nr:hypothetical protein WS86_25315 [Burkholderia savannae]AOK49844.1 hypothetical protein WT60_23505 [Burkholderia sp. MSMB617WGS]KGS02405.1 hypothetical protein X946_3451 [Burkholderia sp. ABCPW 111]KWZ47825.1 hypothetical protein WS73_04565 [Burkholderia savannae]
MRETFIEVGAPLDGGGAAPRDTAYVGPRQMYGRGRRVRSRAGRALARMHARLRREPRACLRHAADRGSSVR